MPVWELLLQEMNKPGKQVRWEHVPAHVNVYGNGVANGLAVEGMCFSLVWSKNVGEVRVRVSQATCHNDLIYSFIGLPGPSVF